MDERLQRTLSVLENFKSKLENDWKYHACRLHRTNSDSCRTNDEDAGRNMYCCTKTFYDTGEIVDWMLLKKEQSEQTNAAALLSAAQDSYHVMRNEPGRSKASDLGKDGRNCYIVFAILLNLDCGFLIHHFQRFNITDGNLRNETLPSLDALKHELQGAVQDVDRLISNFDDMRFMFERVKMDLNMSAVYLDSHQGRWVSPFCKRQLINTKGGTAEVWQVAVQDRILTSELKDRLKRSEYDDPQYGKGPPSSFESIVGFWEDLSKVAEAVESIHNLKVRRELGDSVNFHGWHAHIKPDNILRVRGEYKLADLGFAKFRKKDENGPEPSTGLVGLTETYGAPETDIKRRTRRGGTRTGYTQKIDIWSLGCVFSVAATWVVLGCQGVLIYDKLRQNAINQLRESHAKSTPTADDAFHDGQRVLSAVTEWHAYRRASMRKVDTITSEILDLIDTKMLQSVPHQRLTSRELIDKFAGHVAAVKATHKIQVTRGEVAPLSDHIRDAVAQVEDEAETEGDTAKIRSTNQTGKRSSGAMLAHDSHQSTRLKSSDLWRQAKGSMRVSRKGHIGASSNSSSRVDEPSSDKARPVHAVPMNEPRPKIVPVPIPESPELRNDVNPKASQPPDIVIARCESPETMPEIDPADRLGEVPSLKEAGIPELDITARAADIAEPPQQEILSILIAPPRPSLLVTRHRPKEAIGPSKLTTQINSTWPLGLPTTKVRQTGSSHYISRCRMGFWYRPLTTMSKPTSYWHYTFK
ncbi:uncharacterized protein PG986_009363 [Apiospora aurea]|uniref:Protein kinase domain-containing protein n=1 Tax=Apiospora aurea TaxID=335848 RepID=A0ABR1Q853_9PEZI